MGVFTLQFVLPWHSMLQVSRAMDIQITLYNSHEDKLNKENTQIFKNIQVYWGLRQIYVGTNNEYTCLHASCKIRVDCFIGSLAFQPQACPWMPPSLHMTSTLAEICKRNTNPIHGRNLTCKKTTKIKSNITARMLKLIGTWTRNNDGESMAKFKKRNVLLF